MYNMIKQKIQMGALHLIEYSGIFFSYENSINLNNIPALMA